MSVTAKNERARPGLLLDLDPEFADGLEPRQPDDPGANPPVDVIRVSPGPWQLPPVIARRADIVALVVLDGIICRETTAGVPAAIELICPSDVLLPPIDGTDELVANADSRLTALTPAELIILGQPFLRACAQWPQLLVNLHRRLESQRRRTVIAGLAVHQSRVEDRVLLIVWQLANSCGRMTPDGILLPLGFTHHLLARLTAARRPTVTLALSALRGLGQVRRQDGHLLLTGPALQRINLLLDGHGPGPALGPDITFTIRQPVARHPW